MLPPLSRRLVVLGAVASAAGARAADTAPLTARTRAIEERVRPRLQAALVRRGLSLGAALYLRALKDPGVLEVWVRGDDGRYDRFRTYTLCGGRLDPGPRRRGRALRAPEGLYLLTPGRMDPAGPRYLALELDYPNAYDRARGWSGPPAAVSGACAAEAGFGLPDPSAEEVWALAAAAFRRGQTAIPLHAFPFALTQRALRAAREPSQRAFWGELEPAWRLFEAQRKPPATAIRGGRYVIDSAG